MHVAVIMDGNRRWARAHNVTDAEGHRCGAKALIEAVKAAQESGKITHFTAFAFSTENWKRGISEVEAIFSLIRLYLRGHVQQLSKANVRFLAIGDTSKLPVQLQKAIDHAEDSTRTNTGLTFTLAVNYGGRADILQACNGLPETFERRLQTLGLPDPDLLIRTGGEKRLSNFMLWQIAYTELYFVDTLWPDFTAQDLNDALREFQARSRRYGGDQR